jgi:regulator of sirC expression with transglutaminase-like and TPR domain
MSRTFSFIMLALMATTLIAADYTAPNVVYAGCTVHDAPWRGDLASWAHSKELIGKALGVWYGVPEERQHYRTNPSSDELKELLTETLPGVMAKDDILILYLGAHHLKKGEIMLGHKTIIDGATLAGWLQALDRRTLFLADMCYAQRLESAAFPDNVMVIYGAGKRKLATDLDLDGSHRKTLAFFKETLATVQAELQVSATNFSAMGFTCVHSLLQRRSGQDLIAAELSETMRAEQDHLRQFSKRKTKVPSLLGRNAQRWVLATTRPATAIQVAEPPPCPAVVERVPVQAPAAAARAPLTNHTRGGLQIDTIEAMLKLPESELDVGYGNLLIGEMFDPGMDLPYFLEELDEIAYAIRDRITEPNDRHHVLEVINRYIFQELGFVAQIEPFDEDFLLHVLLEEKRGRCSALVCLYMAIAERLDLSFTSVCVPEHIYIQWPDDDGEPENIETTQEGKILAHEVYVQRCGAEITEKGKKFYLRPLSKQETLATLLSPLGSALRENERYKEAITACRLAISINVYDAEAWNNLGMAYRWDDSNDLAMMSYRKAIAIKPDFAAAWNNMGSVTEDLEERITYYKKATQLDPTVGNAWQNLARAYFDNSDYQLSLACVKQCYKLGYEMPQAFLVQLKEKL